MDFLTNIFSTIGKYADTIGAIGQGVTAVQSYLEQRRAEKQTQQANDAMMKAAQTEAELAKQDAVQKAESARRDAARVRSQQVASYLKSGITLDGSPMLIANETTDQGNRNAANILTNADYSSRAMILRAEGNKQSVKKADIWGTAFDVLGSASKASTAWDKAKKGG